MSTYDPTIETPDEVIEPDDAPIIEPDEEETPTTPETETEPSS
jgi:hypothetical protein